MVGMDSEGWTKEGMDSHPWSDQRRWKRGKTRGGDAEKNEDSAQSVPIHPAQSSWTTSLDLVNCRDSSLQPAASHFIICPRPERISQILSTPERDIPTPPTAG